MAGDVLPRDHRLDLRARLKLQEPPRRPHGTISIEPLPRVTGRRACDDPAAGGEGAERHEERHIAERRRIRATGRPVPVMKREARGRVHRVLEPLHFRSGEVVGAEAEA